MARSFQNDPVEFEAMALAKAKEAEEARQIERAKIVRTLNLPTDDEIIKLRLRACGHPMILFGEDPLHRRERLKEIAATMLTTDDESARRWHEIAETQKQLDESLKAAAAYGKLYYTEGPSELLAARKEIAIFSLQRAQQRLESYRSFTEASHEYIARLQTLSTFYCTGSEVGDTRPLSSCSFSNEVDDTGRPKQVLISSWSGSSFVWDLSTRGLSRKLNGHRDRVSDAKFAPFCNSPSTLSIATGGVDAVVNLYSGESNAPVWTLSGHSDRIARIAFHPNGRHLVSASFDTTFRLWDLETRSCLLIQDGNPRGLYGISFHPDGSLVVTGDLAGNGRVWDLRTGKTIADLVGHIKQVLCVCVSPNGYHVATGSGDNTIRIWDLRKRSCVYTIPGHLNMVSDVKFATRDQFLVSSSYDKTLRLWSARDFSPVKTLSGHEDKLTSADVSEDCRHLISASFDRTWKTWTISGKDQDRMIDA